MPWTPKTTAPAYFSLADAFAALITGDSTWGWLIDWIPLFPDAQWLTSDFCAAGPVFAQALDITDFIPQANPRDPRNFIGTAALIARIGAAGRDRVFGAYCEQAGIGGGGAFGTPDCRAVSASAMAFPATAPTWMLPAGTTKIRGSLLSHTGQFAMQLRHYSGMTSPAGPFTGMTPLLYGDETTRSDGDFNDLTVSAGGCYLSIQLNGSASVCVAFDVADAPTPYVPTAQPEPPGLPPPLGTTGATLVDIAHELDVQEFKLDTLMAWVQGIAGATLDLGGPLADPASLPVNTDVEVGDAVGAVITVSGIPAGLDVGFGTPQQVARLGRINLGTADAWYPMVPLTHSPFVVRPFPPGTTRVSISGLPPLVTASVALILKNK